MNIALELFLAWLGFAIAIGFPTWISLKLRERREKRSAAVYDARARQQQATPRNWSLHQHRVSDGIC